MSTGLPKEIPLPPQRELTSGGDWSKHPLYAHSNPVAIVTGRDGDVHRGCSVGWYTWLSAFPPLIGVSLAKERTTHEAIVKGGFFGLSVLHQSQHKLGVGFGFFSSKDVDKFSRFSEPPLTDTFEAPQSHVRLFRHCVACFELRVVSVTATGDHDFIVGEAVHSFKGEFSAKEGLHCIGPTIFH